MASSAGGCERTGVPIGSGLSLRSSRPALRKKLERGGWNRGAPARLPRTKGGRRCPTCTCGPCARWPRACERDRRPRRRPDRRPRVGRAPAPRRARAGRRVAPGGPARRIPAARRRGRHAHARLPCRAAGDGGPSGPSGCARSAARATSSGSTRRCAASRPRSWPACSRARRSTTRSSSPCRPGRTRGACASAAASARRHAARDRGRAGAVRRRAGRGRGPEALVERVRAGAVRRFVVDGESRRGPARGAEAVAALDGAVVTASPGGWLRYHPVAARAGAGFVLVVLSSNTQLNHRQLEALRRTARSAARARRSAAAPCSSRRSRSRPDDTTVTPPRRRRRRRRRRAARDAHERGLRCRGVVASGGHLASLLVDALGAQRLSVAGEVAPLCARGTLVGGPWSGPARGDEGRPGRRR